MIVTDIVTVIGRGNIVCCDDKTELVNNKVKIVYDFHREIVIVLVKSHSFCPPKRLFILLSE